MLTLHSYVCFVVFHSESVFPDLSSFLAWSLFIYYVIYLLFLLLRVYRNVLSFLHDVVALRVLVLVKFCLIVDTLETITIRKHSLNIELHHKTSAVHFAEYQLVIKEEDMNVRSNNVVAKKTLGRALKKFVGDFKVCYCTQTTF